MSEEMTDDELRKLFQGIREQENARDKLLAQTASMPATSGDIRDLTEVMRRIECILIDTRDDQRRARRRPAL